MSPTTLSGMRLKVAREWHESSDHARDGSPFGSPLCNCLQVADRVVRMLATAYDQGSRARCPDPDRCWCSDFVHTPNRPVTPNPYRGDR